MKRIVFYIAVFFGAMCVGCDSTNSPTSTPIINDTFTTDSAALATSVAIANLQPAVQVACAREAYEVAAAINSAAKTGVVLSDVQSLANSYLKQWNNPYDPVVGQLVNMIIDNVNSKLNPTGTLPPSTQPAVGDAQELLEDLTQGVMNACLSYTGGMPSTPSMAVEKRGASSIIVRHLNWNIAAAR